MREPESGAVPRFTTGFYFQTLSLLFRKPGQFFSRIPENVGFGQPFAFLSVSGVIYVLAAMVTPAPNPLLASTVRLINAIGMPLFTSGVGFFFVMAFIRRRIRYPLFFSVYAYSSGLILLVAWIPGWLWLTELARWVLIGVGLTRSMALPRWQAGVVIVVSIGLTILFFGALSHLLR